VAKDITAEFSSEILNQRAECCETMGQLNVKLDDLDKMVDIDQGLENPELQVVIVYRQAFTTARMGESARV
jgi:hypothetical protein